MSAKSRHVTPLTVALPQISPAIQVSKLALVVQRATYTTQTGIVLSRILLVLILGGWALVQTKVGKVRIDPSAGAA